MDGANSDTSSGQGLNEGFFKPGQVTESNKPNDDNDKLSNEHLYYYKKDTVAAQQKETLEFLTKYLPYHICTILLYALKNIILKDLLNYGSLGPPLDLGGIPFSLHRKSL